VLPVHVHLLYFLYTKYIEQDSGSDELMEHFEQNLGRTSSLTFLLVQDPRQECREKTHPNPDDRA